MINSPLRDILHVKHVLSGERNTQYQERIAISHSNMPEETRLEWAIIKSNVTPHNPGSSFANHSY